MRRAKRCARVATMLAVAALVVALAAGWLAFRENTRRSAAEALAAEARQQAVAAEAALAEGQALRAFQDALPAWLAAPLPPETNRDTLSAWIERLWTRAETGIAAFGGGGGALQQDHIACFRNALIGLAPAGMGDLLGAYLDLVPLAEAARTLETTPDAIAALRQRFRAAAGTDRTALYALLDRIEVCRPGPTTGATLPTQ